MNGRPTASKFEKKEKKVKDKDAVDLKKLTSGGGGFFSGLFGGAAQAQYRSQLMAPDERRRGKARTDYIKSVLESAGVEEDD